MGNCFLHGNGRSVSAGEYNSFTLNVIGSLTSPAQASQNTIWLITDKELTGIVMSGTEPEILAEGEVWISISDNAPSKIVAPVGEELITVYPIYAKQSVNGELVDIEARTFYDGMWVDWISNITLYANGTFYSRYPHKSLITPTSATLTYGEEYLAVTTIASTPNEVYEVFGPMSLKDYQRVVVDLHNGDSNNIYGCILIADSETANRTSAIAKTETEMAGGKSATISIDVSALDTSKSLYIYAGFTTNGGSWGYGRKNLRISSIRMEVPV